MTLRRSALTLLLVLGVATATVACAEYENDDAATTDEPDDTGSSEGGSGDVPTRDEFIAAVQTAQGEAFASNVAEAGIDVDDATVVYEEFIGCTYDEVSDQPDVVRQAIDFEGEPDPDFEARLKELAAGCQDTFNADMRALMAAVPTTTVAP
jgi:hypothetical protein